MTRRALGKGLNALLSDFDQQSEEVREIDVDLIAPNPEQPRSDFAEDKIRELAESIKASGLVQPILIRSVAGGRYQIIAGERRWRAAKLIGLDKISAIVRNIDDSKLLEVALIENIQRQELNPIEEALAYKRLTAVLGLTQEEVAHKVGKDRSSVANYLRLLKLPDGIQARIGRNHLSMGHARALLGLDSVEEQEALTEEIIRKKLSVRETEQKVQRLASKTNRRSARLEIQADANIRSAEVKLKRHLETKVRIKLSSQGGKIELHFTSLDDLDRIYSKILTPSSN
jgi:ParB family transcriptional regulator, chromosome partitioning protein